MSEPITRMTCEACGRDGDPNGPKAAQEYAKEGKTNRDKVERFNAFVGRHPYLRRCLGCKLVRCTRPECKCRC